MINENEKYEGEEKMLDENIEEKDNLNEQTEAVDEAMQEAEIIEELPPIEQVIEEDACNLPPIEPGIHGSDYTEAESSTVYEQTEPPKKKGKAGKVILITGVCAALACVVFAAASFATKLLVLDYSASVNIGTTQDATDIGSTDKTLLNYSLLMNEEGEMSIEDIVEACLPSVVSITNKGVSEIMTFFGNYQTESISSGSGIIVGQNDKELLIVTNYHVVADSKELTVVFSHEEAEALKGDTSYMNVAQVKGYDANKDIAVISVKLSEISDETKKEIKVAAIGNSDDIKLGSGVVAIGNSLGYGQSVTHGIVSALDREITMQGSQNANKYIQTDAAINGGNSGGALLNMKGELIGINTAKIAASGVEGMGYAIPITDVEDLINNLMTLKTREVVDEKDRGYLGIYGVDVTATDSQKYGMPMGVFVQELIANSPAAKSDLQTGDVIVKIDDISVSTMASLQDRLTYYRKGETVTLTVKRIEGRRYVDKEVSITLGSKEAAGIE